MQEYHKLPDGRFISDKGKYYMDKRDKHPKEGIRTYIAGEDEKFAETHKKVFGTYTCEVCGVEVLFKRTRCDKHPKEES